MTAGHFTRDDTNFYKGVAILMIAIHNYFHVRQGFHIENEMTFSPDNIRQFWGHITSLNLDDTVAAWFSLLGHYGVQLFIFFSAYGLSIQYARHQGSDFAFVGHRLKKIYFLMLFGIVVALIFAYAPFNDRPGVLWVTRDTLLLGSTLNAFSRAHIYGLFKGPFWFFGLIIQVYVLFPWIYRYATSGGRRTMALGFAIAYAALYAGYYLGLGTSINVMGSVIGHAPEVLLGIALARYGVPKLSSLHALPLAALFIASQIWEWAYVLSFACVTLLLIWIAESIKPHLNDVTKRTLIYTGKISMIIFIVNACVRDLRYFDSHTLAMLPIYLPVLGIASIVLWKIYEFLSAHLKI